jgi:hypothetical protein
LPAGDAQADELAKALPDGVAILFVSRFQGDRLPRLVETWKVNSTRLEELLQLPLPPVDPADREKNLQRNARELADLLKEGERLSEEWSPVMAIAGKLYIVERECSGRWAYGGYYACSELIKLTFKRIEPSGKSRAYCQLASPRKKPQVEKSR